MIIEFGVRNFRSIKEWQYLTLETQDKDYKQDNYTTATNYSKLKVLSSATIYGANASGKSNFIKALNALHQMVLNSSSYQVDEIITFYDPFRLDPDFINKEVEFYIDFIADDQLRYQYNIAFVKNRITKEELFFYPKSRKALLFSRILKKNEFTTEYGSYLTQKNKLRSLLSNQLLLSTGAKDNHAILMQIYRFFKKMMVWNAHSKRQLRELQTQVEEWMSRNDKKEFRKRLIRLIQLSDTKIKDIKIFNFDEFNIQYKQQLEVNMRKQFLIHQKYMSMASHQTYKNGEAHGVDMLPLSEESEGTQMLFNLGGYILHILDKGGILIIDELETSLHPKLSRFLVNLFHYEEINGQNAQLIFATHETSLLSESLFRKDQIWLTEKDKKGQSELFSLVDIEGLSYDAPFEKWYLQGKFGAQPFINEIEFIFGNESTEQDEK